MTDIRKHNRTAWDRQVELQNTWTIPVDAETVARARAGDWSVLLTPTIPVPRDWFPPLAGLDLLGLASGGGQQGPILAAAGARVTILDNSPRQLAQDAAVAAREGLSIRTLLGDMASMPELPDASFDCIFHPVSNLFVPEVRPVWREAFRLLRPGGALLAGFNNPVRYLFDLDLEERERRLEVRHSLPYNDLDQLPAARLEKLLQDGEPLEFSHTLDDQLGGQLEAGFFITGFYEDKYHQTELDLLSAYMPSFLATRALKPR